MKPQLFRLGLPFTFLLISLPATTHGQECVLPMSYDRYITIRALINDKHEANLVVDSGADGLLLDAQYFTQKGMVANSVQRAQLPGAGSGRQTVIVVLDRTTVKAGDLEYIPPYVPLIDLRGILGEKVDGIISPELFGHRYAHIDYAGKRITLSEKNNAMAGYDSVALQINSNRFYLPVSIRTKEGTTITGKCQLDLGNGGDLVLTSPVAQKHQLAATVKQKLKYFNNRGGVGGRVEGYVFRAQSLQIASFHLSEPVVEFSMDSLGALSRHDYMGLLGNNVLDRFDVIINFRKGMLYLKPGPKFPARFPGGVSGISYVNNAASDGALKITGLTLGGNGEKAGLNPDDQILAIDGKPVSSLTNEMIADYLSREGHPLTLDCMRNGKRFTTTLVRKEMI